MLADGILKITRKQLYDEIWQLSVSGVAKKYDLVYSRLMKACKEYDIPYPSSTYWARLEFGKTGPEDIIPLPGDGSIQIQLLTREQIELKKAEEAEAKKSEKNGNAEENLEEKRKLYEERLQFLDEEERNRIIQTALHLKVPAHGKVPVQLVSYNKDVSVYRRQAREMERKKYFHMRYEEPEYVPPFITEISYEAAKRIPRMLKPLFVAVMEHGGVVNDDFSVTIRDMTIEIRITEDKSKIKHVLTSDERIQLYNYEQNVKAGNSYYTKPRFKRFDYVYNGILQIEFQGKQYAKDTKEIKLEDIIGELFVCLIERCEELRIEKKEKEEAERRAKEKREEEIRIATEKRRKAKELNAQRMEELANIKELIGEASDYMRAIEIRKYIEAVTASDCDKNTSEWIEWAKKIADWFDPMVGKTDEVLGKRNHSDAYNGDELEVIKKRLEKELSSYWY